MPMQLRPRQCAGACAIAVALSGCALKGDVRCIEDQLAQYREETARTDSIRTEMLARLIDEVARTHGESSQLLDSLHAELQSLYAMQGEFRGQMTGIQQKLGAIEELTGQSQAGLNALRDQIRRPVIQANRENIELGAAQPPGEEGPDALFEMGRTQLQRGSPNTARIAFRRVLDGYPEHERAADALYWMGESFRADEPDSAVAAFEQVVERYPESPRAPSALYKIGLEADRQGDRRAARRFFRRLVEEYPDSDEADLARSRLGRRSL